MNPGLPEPTAAPRPGAPATSVPSSGPTTAAQPSGGGNPLDALGKAFTSWGSVKSFRMHVSTAGAPEVTVEVVMPDRYHINTGQAEMIMIGNTTYIKMGNTWQKMNIPGGGASAFNPDTFSPKTFATQLQNLPDVKFLGADTVDGVPCTVYQITPKGGGSASTTKFWIGVGDGFPHKIESGAATITFTDFNGNITINPPIP